MGLINPQSKTWKFFSTLSKLCSKGGLSNMWVEKGHQSKWSKYFHRIVTIFLVGFVVMEFLAFFTQPNLTDKQVSDRLLFCISHPILFSYYVGCEYYKKEFNALFVKLCIILKDGFNDPEAERRMIKKATRYAIAYIVNCSVALISYGFDGIMQVLRSGGSFTTVILAWPDVEDMSMAANIMRMISYVLWWTFMTRVSAALILVMVTTIALSHQYINLQSYFYSLNDIFDDVNEENIQEKQSKYEKALKVGINLHYETLWCNRQCQVTCSLHFSGQVIMNVSVFSLLMLQMVNSERTLMNAMAIVTTSVALLTATGFFMWNAGDITVEGHISMQSFIFLALTVWKAARVPTAMYSSGWQHCRGKTSRRVGTLLVVAMTQAQKHEVIRSMGILEASYQSFLTIVKSSYSAFSLLY